jgi:hypothetical protein
MSSRNSTKVSDAALFLSIALYIFVVFIYVPGAYDFIDADKIMLSPVSIRFVVLSLVPLITNVVILKKIARRTDGFLLKTVLLVLLVVGYLGLRYLSYMFYEFFMQTLLWRTNSNFVLSELVFYASIFFYWFFVFKVKKGDSAFYYLLELIFVSFLSLLLAVI